MQIFISWIHQILDCNILDTEDEFLSDWTRERRTERVDERNKPLISADRNQMQFSLAFDIITSNIIIVSLSSSSSSSSSSSAAAAASSSSSSSSSSSPQSTASNYLHIVLSSVEINESFTRCAVDVELMEPGKCLKNHFLRVEIIYAHLFIHSFTHSFIIHSHTHSHSLIN